MILIQVISYDYNFKFRQRAEDTDQSDGTGTSAPKVDSSSQSTVAPSEANFDQEWFDDF